MEFDAVFRSYQGKHWKNRTYNAVTKEECGNATEFDAVFRDHQIKHWKNGKSDAVTTEMTAEIITWSLIG